MGITKFKIHEDIRKASTLPAEFYINDEALSLCRTEIFRKFWHIATDVEKIKIPGQVYPFTLLEDFIDEPLLLTRDWEDKIHCLSNVCTHRGSILVENPQIIRTIQCRYHGRRFELNGKFISMPEMEGAENFPSYSDNLTSIPVEIWKNFIFISPDPVFSFKDISEIIDNRLEGVIMKDTVSAPSLSRDYLIKCNWALYVENYLEGFHIPYVHKGLNEKLDYSSYSVEIYNHSVLQLGITSNAENSFVLKEISPDYGRDVAAYYWWIFPNLMLNFYPWGISVNIVKPVTKDLTKVSYLTYISEHAKYNTGAGTDLDRVEREDEVIVESVQRGIRSSFYRSGRYSPKREEGVHYFHRLIAKYLGEE